MSFVNLHSIFCQAFKRIREYTLKTIKSFIWLWVEASKRETGKKSISLLDFHFRIFICLLRYSAEHRFDFSFTSTKSNFFMTTMRLFDFVRSSFLKSMLNFFLISSELRFYLFVLSVLLAHASGSVRYFEFGTLVVPFIRRDSTVVLVCTTVKMERHTIGRERERETKCSEQNNRIRIKMTLFCTSPKTVQLPHTAHFAIAVRMCLSVDARCFV